MDQIMQYPEVSFIEDTTLEEVQQQLVQDYCNKYKEITGKEKVLHKADPYRMMLYACALQQYQTLLYLDRAGKQNLLKYSCDDFLDELGKLRGMERKQGEKAVTTLKFSLSKIRNESVIIEAGTRVTNGTMLYFSTDDTVEIKQGELEVEVSATCTEKGTKANDFEAGEFKILSDFIPYITSVENIIKTGGGEDRESNENFAERIFLAPSSYSVAGPEDAYKFWIKSFQTDVTDIKITSPSPSVVDIRFLNNTEIPSQAIIEKIEKNLSSKEIRPLTDKVEVKAPEKVLYEIDFTYYINESNKNIAHTIQEKVRIEVENYVIWQKSKIGRDINPSELLYYLKKAGVKRADIRKPMLQEVDIKSVAILESKNIVFGGIEDD